MKRPKLRTPMGLMIAAAVCWAVAGMVPTRTWQLVMEAVLVVLVGGALWSGLDLLSFTVIDRVRLWQDARQAMDLARITAYKEHALVIRSMTDDQLAAYGRHRAEIETTTSNVEPIYTLILPFCRVPWDFVETYMMHCTETHLAETRRWGEGSKPREYAQALTDYFVGEGYAMIAAGNQTARWLGPAARAAGLQSIGWEG